MENLDHILLLQLAVARLGERELQGWWNTDIAYKLGGAGFLERMAGTEMAPFAAGEGVLLAARLHEEAILDSIPGNPCFSLFCPLIPLRNELIRRYHHFKRYPDDTPDEIRAILDKTTEWNAVTLRSLIGKLTGGKSTEWEGTSFGREITGPTEGTFASEEAAMNALAASYLALEKGQYVLPYCRSVSGAR